MRDFDDALVFPVATAQQESSDRNGEENAAIIQHRATILESGLAGYVLANLSKTFAYVNECRGIQ